jgi:cytoskeletal protein CcmA (bactofilin family)
MRIRSFAAAVIAFIFIAMPAAALAADFRAAEGRQEVRGAVDDDVYIAGDEIVVSGEVTGDVFAAGRRVRLTGSTGQSLFAGAQDIDISGRVDHSARVAGQNVTVSGTIAQDLLGAGQAMIIEADGSVGRDIWAGGQDLTVDGSVGRDIRGAAASVTISGTVGGNVEVDSESVTIADGAVITGDLVYTSSNEADIDPGAEVAGEVTRREPEARPADDSNPVVDTILGFLRGVAGSFVLGLVLLWLVPALLPTLAKTMRTSVAPSLGIGLAGLFAVPVIALIAFVITLFIGAFGSIPVLMLAVYGFLLLLAKAAVGYLIGQMVLKQNEGGSFGDSLKALAVGVTLLTLVELIPFVGGLVGFIVAVLALGAGILAFVNWRKSRDAPASPPPPTPEVAAA